MVRSKLKPILIATALIAFAIPVFGTGPETRSDDRPNIIVVLVDDMGFSDLGCFGSEIDTPNIDRLAANGLRFTQFYNQGRCCPTRASLMTGLQPHQVGIGHMTAPPNQPLGFEGPYQGYLNEKCTTLAEVLKAAGYTTLMSGKWHLGMNTEAQPLQRGFDRFYGCLSGAINYFKPGGDRMISEGDEVVSTPADFYATDAFTSKAIEYIAESQQRPEPFFLYLAYNAPHWPLNAKWKDYQKYRGRYKVGWQQVMQARQAKQNEIQLFAETVTPAPFPGPEWDSLSNKQKDRLDAIMSAYAGCIDSIDQNIGRLTNFLDEQGELENTVILFLSDNGACQEGGLFGRGDEAMVKNPPLETTNGVRLGQHWAGACNTPFRKYKHFVHEGGACTPMIAHWPKGIATAERGGFVRQSAYLQDIMPTVIELANGKYPDSTVADSREIEPCLGKSIVSLLSGDQEPIHSEMLFWEHEGNAAARDGNWKLVREYKKPWELYNLSLDRTELNDLSGSEPKRRQQMIEQWEAWATQNGVSFPERFNMYEYLKEMKKKKATSQ